MSQFTTFLFIRIRLDLFKFLLIVNLTLNGVAVNGADEGFQHLTTANGLSSNLVTSILQDQRGFLWIGTEKGLNRYDGYEFQVYRHQKDAAGSISHSEIRTLLLDSSGRLWIGTSAGLNRFDSGTLRFDQFGTGQGDEKLVTVTAIAEVSPDRLIVGTEHGLLWFETRSGGFTPFLSGPQAGHPLNRSEINSILRDSQGRLWVGTGERLFRQDYEGSPIVQYYHDNVDQNTLIEGAIETLFEDSAGSIWIGIDGGLSKLNPGNNFITNYYHEEDGTAGQLVGDEVLDVTQDETGYLWIATTEGLNRYDIANNEFNAYIHHPDFADSLSHSQTTSLYVDLSGILWTGTKGGGLSRLNLERKPFHRAQHHPGDDLSLGYDSVLSFHEDSAQRIWVGLNDEGFNLFDPFTGQFERFEYEAEKFPTTATSEGVFYIDSGGIHKDRVRSVQTDADGNLWLGTSEGLEFFDINAIRFRHFRPQEGRPHSLSSENISVLLMGSEDTLWLGTEGGGLNRFNPQTYEVKVYLLNTEDPQSISSNQITSVIQGRNNLLWIGTQGGGINRFDPVTERFISYQVASDGKAGLSHNDVWTVHQDKKGNLWIGTSNGLNRLDPDTGSIQQFGEQKGIRNPFILGILEDDEGNLWLSKEKGISKFNPETFQVRNYNARNGLPTDQFLQGAYFRSSKGIFYLGTNQGMVYFNPAGIKENDHIPPVVLTRLQIFNETVLPGAGSPLEVDISETRQFSLSYRDRAISLNFAALDFANPDNNQYQYKLEGFDPEWRISGRQRMASYTSLPAGKYVFRVRASNNDGVWNEEGLSVEIEVTPPPWLTLWAFTLYGFVVVGGIYGYIRYRTLKFRVALEAREKANLILEQKVADRTKELNLKNNELQRSNKNIISSIQYAQRIQQSLLPNDNHVRQLFDDCFIVWQPRDIVGGDIYYIDRLEGLTVVAVIDCTGHGVPGAFMTMLASSGLRRITVDEKCLNPAEILSRLNMIVKKSLQQDTKHVPSDDGMDAAICVVNPDQRCLSFAGANLPLTYIQKGKIQTIKGNRQSIGYKKSDIAYEFTNHMVEIDNDMIFYMHTDGITDQLGGEKRRMFGNRRLREALLKSYSLPSEEHKEQVIVEFEKYRSENGIQDDITLIGFRL